MAYLTTVSESMEIKLNGNVDSVPKVGVNPVKAPEPKQVARDGVSFEGAEALNRALSSTPDVRSEVVDQGRELASNVHYPPPEVIKRISVLVAAQFSEEEQ